MKDLGKVFIGIAIGSAILGFAAGFIVGVLGKIIF